MRQRILEAGIRVLQTEGPLGFTTTRVAAEASISVGSLYQYFPNKQALVVAIHEQLVVSGLEHAMSILGDESLGRRDKLFAIVRWFFEAEAKEARDLGRIVGDIEVFLHHHTGERNELEAAARQAFTETLGLNPLEAAYAVAVIRSVGKAAASERLAELVLRDWADRTSTILADHFRLV
ncbi:TetR/AcrR family transcriptional regulator [Acidimicrobiaceae bacterium AH-315-P05]|nr:TetR/AcrR family transcriptional regulator [Acidimicrobiaceae bacterium AH-315-P05]